MILIAKVKTILLMLVAILFVLTVLNCVLRKEGISKKDVTLRLVLLRRRILLLTAATCLFGGLYCASQYIVNSRERVLTLKLTYEEAAKGQNPNKTRFNISELFSKDILEEVIKRGNLPMSADELAECLAFNTSLDNQEVGAASSLRIATEYQVVCTDQIFHYAVNPKMVIELLADVYYESFLKNNTESDEILKLNFEDVSDLDYMDLEEFFKLGAQKLQRYINYYKRENPSYRSESQGESFASLSEKIDNFINVELERYRSYVLENGLSKNSDEYRKRMDYENRLLQVEKDKDMAAYNVRLETINLYDEQMARIVLVPTSDQSQEYYMSRTKIGVDYFADEADAYLKQATDVQEEIDHNAYAKLKMETSASGSDQYGQVTAMIEKMQDELELLSEKCQAISDVYIQEKRDGYLKTEISQVSTSQAFDWKHGVMYSVLFFVFSSTAFLTAGQKKKVGEKQSDRIGRKQRSSKK